MRRIHKLDQKESAGETSCCTEKFEEAQRLDAVGKRVRKCLGFAHFDNDADGWENDRHSTGLTPQLWPRQPHTHPTTESRQQTHLSLNRPRSELQPKEIARKQVHKREKPPRANAARHRQDTRGSIGAFLVFNICNNQHWALHFVVLFFGIPAQHKNKTKKKSQKHSSLLLLVSSALLCCFGLLSLSRSLSRPLSLSLSLSVLSRFAWACGRWLLLLLCFLGDPLRLLDNNR